MTVIMIFRRAITEHLHYARHQLGTSACIGDHVAPYLQVRKLRLTEVR